jgi:hypothetical protein
MRDHHFQTHQGLWGSSKASVPRVIGWFALGIILVVLFALIFGLFVQFIWNWLMPELFGLKHITYWQAFGIVVLAKLLFGGFGHRHSEHRKKFLTRHDEWHRQRILAEDDQSVPEETQKHWEHYGQFWRDEGRAAFQAYIDKIEKEKDNDA